MDPSVSTSPISSLTWSSLEGEEENSNEEKKGSRDCQLVVGWPLQMWRCSKMDRRWCWGRSLLVPLLIRALGWSNADSQGGRGAVVWRTASSLPCYYRDWWCVKVLQPNTFEGARPEWWPNRARRPEQANHSVLPCSVPVGGLHPGRTKDWRRREVGPWDLQYHADLLMPHGSWLWYLDSLCSTQLPGTVRKGWAAGLQDCEKEGGNRPSSSNAGRDQSFSPCLDWICRGVTEEGRVGVKGLWIFPLLAIKSAGKVVAPASHTFF